ncbi:MAG: hypothetical protein JSW55_08295, partial [Chloroflexota bacterium]
MIKKITLASIGIALLALSGCQQTNAEQEPIVAEPGEQQPAATIAPADYGKEEGQPSPQPGASPEQVTVSTAAGIEAVSYGYTHQQPDGNRLVPGRGALPEATVIDVALAGRPAWVVGAPILELSGQVMTGAASIWVVVLDDGRVQAFTVEDGQVAETAIEPDNLADMPPLLQVTGRQPALLTPPSPAYGFSPPAILDEAGGQAIITPDGVLTILDDQGAPLAAAESRPLA